MTDRDLGRALLNLDAAAISGKNDIAAKTEGILRQDRLRVRLLTWATVAVWVLALVLIFGDLVIFGLLFPRHALYLQQLDAGEITPALRDAMQRELFISFQMGTLIIALSVFITTLAAFLTVLLIFATRRATLRQVNANLAEICEQLRQMRGKSAAAG
jgi:hypothetical protein